MAMKDMVSATELARNTARVRKRLSKRRLMIVTRRGKPAALLIATNEKMLQSDLAIVRRARVASRPVQNGEAARVKHLITG